MHKDLRKAIGILRKAGETESVPGEAGSVPEEPAFNENPENAKDEATAHTEYAKHLLGQVKQSLAAGNFGTPEHIAMGKRLLDHVSHAIKHTQKVYGPGAEYALTGNRR